MTDIKYLTEEESLTVIKDLKRFSNNQLVDSALRFKDMPTCFTLVLDEIKYRLDQSELHQLRNELTALSDMVRRDRLSNTRRAKVAQDILRYQLDAIKEQLPSLDLNVLKLKIVERLRKYKDDMRVK